MSTPAGRFNRISVSIVSESVEHVNQALVRPDSEMLV